MKISSKSKSFIKGRNFKIFQGKIPSIMTHWIYDIYPLILYDHQPIIHTGMDTSVIILISLIPLFFLLGILIYNRLIKAKNQVDLAFGSVDVQLKKRYDLIPNLVTTVKAYMKHEKEILTELTILRTKFLSTDITQEEKVDIENQLNRSMKGFSLTVENYPDLKASRNFVKLQEAWNKAEGQIAAARRFFNSAVTDYNNKIAFFPNNLIAKMMHYKPKNIFEIPEEERQIISAKELFSN